MRQLKNVALSVVTLSLSACGGGGGTNSTPTPPSSQINTTLDDLEYSQTFSAFGADVRFTVSPSGSATLPSFGGGVQGGTIFPTDVSYDASSNSYIVKNADLAAIQFSPSDRVTDESNAAISVYEKTNGSSSDSLVLFNAGSGNPTLALTYSSYGAWQHTEQGASGLNVRTVFFSYGLKTASSDMPRTGSASYQTIIDGQFADADGVYAVAGNGNVNADFGLGTLDISMSPTGQNLFDGSILNFGTLTGAGSIDFNGSSFSTPQSLQTAGQSYRMLLQGQFYGPAAQEIGGIFLLNGDGGAGSGAIAGTKD